MRRFNLVRHRDISGISGTGMVAQGCVFDSGKVALSWVTEVRSVAVYDSLSDLQRIHGHNGATEVRFVDMDDEAGRGF